MRKMIRLDEARLKARDRQREAEDMELVRIMLDQAELLMRQARALGHFAAWIERRGAPPAARVAKRAAYRSLVKIKFPGGEAC